MALHKDAKAWAGSVRSTEPHEPRDAEQAVLDRAGFVLDRRHRSRGVWSFLDERSTAFKLFAVTSMLAPILGTTAFWAGGLTGRGYRDYDFGSSTENTIAVVTFAIAALCQLVHIAGWLRLGRRSVESDLVRAGAVTVCSVLTLIQIWVRPGPFDLGSGAIVVAALVVALVGLLLFLAAGSTAPFPDIDLTRLSDDDRDTLLAQRAAALTKLAERKLIKIRQANKATERPLGSLVGRRIE